VVVGLVLSGVSYFTTLVRERWMRRELKDLESLCELIMRGVKARRAIETIGARARTAAAAAAAVTPASTHSSQETAYARV
jgi:hypothetical protein